MYDHESSNIPTSQELDNNTRLYYLHNCDRCAAKSATNRQNAIEGRYHLPEERLANPIEGEQQTLSWHTREADLRERRNKRKAARQQLEILQERERDEIRATWKYCKELWPGLDG